MSDARPPLQHVSASQPRSAPKRRPGNKRTAVQKIVLSMGVVSTLIALLSAGVLAWGLDKWNAIETVEIAGLGGAEEGEASNWLLVGSDSREGIDADDPNAGVILGEGVPAGKRTDTIIIARVDPAQSVVHLLSLPRDLLVNYSDGGDGRINAAFTGEGGEQRLLQTIEQSFDIEINHYAEINLAGFQDIVDSIGGVPIWFDRPMRDAGSGLDIGAAGCHELTGSQALAFARGRNLEYFEDGEWRTDGTGDLGRSSRQQYFLRRVAATVVKRVDVTDISTINEVLNAGGQNFTKDQTVGPDDLVDLARTLANLSDDQIVGHSLPVFDFRTASGAAVLGLEQEAAEPIFAIFRGEQPETVAAQVAPATYVVLNGNRVAGQATEIAKLLNQHGMDVPSVGNAPTSERTIVRYAPGQEHAAGRLAAFLIAGPAYEVDPTLTDVVLVAGLDFEGLRDTPRDDVEIPASAASTPTTTPAPAGLTQSTVGVVPGPTPAGTLCE